VVIQSIENPWLIASLDGYRCNDDQHEILEIKYPNQQVISMALNQEVPDYYMVQMQGQMWLSGATYCTYVVGREGKEPIYFSVEKDYDQVMKIKEAVFDFYDRVLSFRPPEPTERDTIVVMDKEALLKAKRLLTVRGMKKELEMEEESLMLDLKSFAHAPIVQIGNLVVQQVTRKGNVDYDSIEELKKIDLESYRKPSSVGFRFYEKKSK